MEAVRKNRYGQEKPCWIHAAEQKISTSAVWRTFRQNGLRSVKPTVKPGLTAAMKEARLQFALQYKDWGIEEWKCVIWSDETSVILNHYRGKRWI